MIFVKTLMNTIQNDYPIRLVKKTYSKKLILIVTELCIRGGKLNLLKIAKTLSLTQQILHLPIIPILHAPWQLIIPRPVVIYELQLCHLLNNKPTVTGS